MLSGRVGRSWAVGGRDVLLGEARGAVVLGPWRHRVGVQTALGDTRRQTGIRRRMLEHRHMDVPPCAGPKWPLSSRAATPPAAASGVTSPVISSRRGVCFFLFYARRHSSSASSVLHLCPACIRIARDLGLQGKTLRKWASTTPFLPLSSVSCPVSAVVKRSGLGRCPMYHL